jgi:formate dehydrogenase iron-sulfur subunit
VGQAPACAKACPTQAISFGTKEDMTHWAEARIADLKERGYEQAGLYDPQGVGGTHVMYVLKHADRPEIYANLPKEPKISGLVEAWKGLGKPIALAGIGLAALLGLMHYVTAGPNEVEEEDEEKAKRVQENPKS